VNRRTQPEQYPAEDEVIGESEEMEDAMEDTAPVGSGNPAFDAYEANKAKPAAPMMEEESRREAFEDQVHDEREADANSAADKIAATRRTLADNAQQNRERVNAAMEARRQHVEDAYAKVDSAKREYADTKAREAFTKEAAVAGLRHGERDGEAAVAQMRRKDDREDRNREIREHQAEAAADHEAHIQANREAVNRATQRRAEDMDYHVQKHARETNDAMVSSDRRAAHVEDAVNAVEPFIDERGDSEADDWNAGTARSQDAIASAAAGEYPP